MGRGSRGWCWVSLCFPWKQMAPCRGNQYGTERGTLAKTMCKHEHKLCFTGALIHEDIKGVTCGTSPTRPQRSNCKLAALYSAGLVQHFPASGCLSHLAHLAFCWGWCCHSCREQPSLLAWCVLRTQWEIQEQEPAPDPLRPMVA